MPEKNTKKVPANNKKAEVKKVEKRVEESVKKEVKEEVEKVEKKVEAFEKKADKEVDNLVKKVWFVDKIINASWVKEILNLSFMESANVRVRKHLEKICKVLWIIWLVCGIIFAIFSVITFISWIIALFSGKVWIFLLSLIYVVLAALVIIMARGLMKMKKWYPAASVICFALDIVCVILAIFVPSVWFGSSLLWLIISFICLLFILKNKDMFKN